MTAPHIHQRDIARVRDVRPDKESPNHTVAMVLEPGRWTDHDPFLLLAEDWFGHGTFDVHPHRGIETVTYVIEGKLNHYDNQFGDGALEPGDVQWMTAGSGVIHKEDPIAGERVHSLQLWVNLPREYKMTEPRYQNLRAKDMPVYEEAGSVIRIFSGSSHGVFAPTQNYVPVTMVELNLEAGVTVTQDLLGDYNGFIYVLEGSGQFGLDHVEGHASQVLWLGATDSEQSEIEIHATERLRAILYAGRPLREPVVAYGPFVMNTREEILQAFDDYQNGRFAK